MKNQTKKLLVRSEKSIHSQTPRIEINLTKIAHNAEQLCELYRSKEIDIMGVTKVVCGDPMIAKVLVAKGINVLTDSKLINIKKMRDAKIKATFVLLKTPAMSEIEAVVKYADISMNTELSVIKRLSIVANQHHIRHQVILMVEMGDLREGIMPANIEQFITETQKLSGIKIVGIGANFACLSGVKPSAKSMLYFSSLASQIELKFSLPLLYISGGNSANYNWFMTSVNTMNINNVRLGESIFLGREPLDRKVIPNLFTDAFTFVSEVIEAKIKPSVPYGDRSLNALGDCLQFRDEGDIKRAILGVGQQDVRVSGLKSRLNFEIIGSSSDHMILNAQKADLKVGDEVEFDLNYGALLSVMTSPYVKKKYVYSY